MIKTTYEKPNLLLNRYSKLLVPSVHSPREVSQELNPTDYKQYASFLRDKERRCGPDGFIDSVRYKHNYSANKKNKHAEQPSSSVDIVVDREKKKDDFERRTKLIEDHMWQHKQEEREIKRIDGDIVKNQRIVKNTLRDFENSISKKRIAQDKSLNDGLEKYTKLIKENLHKKEIITKQRIDSSLAAEQVHKSTARKVHLVTSDLARQFQSKLDNLMIMKSEVETLSKSYEVQLRSKENEHFKLQKELADIAISINLEAQKGRKIQQSFENDERKEKLTRITTNRVSDQQLDSKLSKSDGDVKNSVANRRRLSANLTLTKAHLSLKQKEEGRQKITTDTRLRNNIIEQKVLNDLSQHLDLEDKSRHIHENIQNHENRRVQRSTEINESLKARQLQHEQIYSSKFNKKFIDQRRRIHEDHLKHFQKMVGKGENTEYNLHGIVRTSEYARQQQQRKVRQLNSKLSDLKRKNTKEIREKLISLSHEEKSLEQQLQREKAQLDKVHTQREETYLVLQHHRHKLRNDRYLLDEHAREHGRLMRVGVRTGQNQMLNAA